MIFDIAAFTMVVAFAVAPATGVRVLKAVLLIYALGLGP
jgi:hypothetical protein